MFDSLKEWMTADITILPYEGMTASADKKFGEPVIIKGYFAGAIQVINELNSSVVDTKTQIYFDSTEYDVTEYDRVLVDGQEQDIFKITHFMDGNTGESSIKVIYL